MRELGIGAYRFSVAWPRILPMGRGTTNEAGLAFYDRLVDALLEAKIEPWLCLYHWDLPQALEDKGGWRNRDVAYWYADYAAIVARRLADNVRESDIAGRLGGDEFGVILVHADHDAALAKAHARYGDAIPPREHPNIRSREACLKSTRLAVALARKHGSRLHVPHVSTAEELALFEPGPIQGKQITAETCVHFLQFDDRDYARLGFRIKCNPAIKSSDDREALIAALADGRIDILATDHAPHLLEEKSNPYDTAPSGLPLVQFALQVALQRVAEGKLTIERVVEAASHASAIRFDVKDRGYLREGYAADLVLVDPHKAHTVTRAEVLSKCGWSPFEGLTFGSSIVSTFVNGQRVWDGTRIDDQVRGQRLLFDR